MTVDYIMKELKILTTFLQLPPGKEIIKYIY